jgi:hypothetical protein
MVLMPPKDPTKDKNYMCVLFLSYIFPNFGNTSASLFDWRLKKGEENISIRDACHFPQTKFGKERSHVLKNDCSRP